MHETRTPATRDLEPRKNPQNSPFSILQHRATDIPHSHTHWNKPEKILSDPKFLRRTYMTLSGRCANKFADDVRSEPLSRLVFAWMNDVAIQSIKPIPQIASDNKKSSVYIAKRRHFPIRHACPHGPLDRLAPFPLHLGFG
jgi:hypothetical protein